MACQDKVMPAMTSHCGGECLILFLDVQSTFFDEISFFPMAHHHQKQRHCLSYAYTARLVWQNQSVHGNYNKPTDCHQHDKQDSGNTNKFKGQSGNPNEVGYARTISCHSEPWNGENIWPLSAFCYSLSIHWTNLLRWKQKRCYILMLIRITSTMSIIAWTILYSKNRSF